VPGLLGAVGLAMILWPPRPIDEIPMVVEPAIPSATQEAIPDGSDTFTVPKERACNVKMRSLESPTHLGDIAGTAVQNQLRLDREKDEIARCVELENNRKGFEKTQNDHLALDIADIQKLLSSALETYGKYEKVDNPLASRFQEKVDTLQRKLSKKRSLFLRNEQSIRDRDLYLAELARYDKIISDRLTDPGRLRPRKTFDDMLAALVNHLVAFILLAITLGVVLTPLSQAASAGFFDQLFPEGY